MKFRKASKHFIEHKPEGGIIIRGYFCIEVLNDGKWGLLGGDNGIYKFSTEQARDMKLSEIKEVFARQYAKKNDVITTRYSGNTYIARWRGKTASCTAGHVQAASAVAAKVLGIATFKLKPCGGGRFSVILGSEG